MQSPRTQKNVSLKSTKFVIPVVNSLNQIRRIVDDHIHLVSPLHRNWRSQTLSLLLVQSPPETRIHI